MAWNPDVYLRFREERTQPARDLLARIAAAKPARVLDVGCGPGNSTILLAERWPDAEVVGIDSSPEMIAKAKKDHPGLAFRQISAGDDGVLALGAFDVVFSNAALQWIPDHASLLRRLFALVKDGGVLAVQVPNNGDSPMHKAVRAAAASAEWRDRIAEGQAQTYDSAETYYCYLSSLDATVNIWECIYYHVMGSLEDLIDWQRGTHLRQFLDQLPDDKTREELVDTVRTLATGLYPAQPNGRILFPFQRLFFTVHKPGE